MNCKVAKAIRREIRYHPSAPRKYVWDKIMAKRAAKSGGETSVERYQLVLHDADPRALYQEMKKDYYRTGRIA